MVICPICLDKLNNPIETYCGHKFCKKCFEKTQKYQKNCPVCRTYFEDSYSFFNLLNTKTFNTEDSLLKNYICSSKLCKPDILAWSDRERYFSPLYLVKTRKNKTICISSYLRHIMIYNNLSENYTKLYISKSKVSFYCTDQKFHPKFTKQYYYIMEEWIYEVVQILHHEFDFYNYSYLNVLISDLVMYYINKYKITIKEFYQVIICSSIFVAMEIYNKTYFKPPKKGDFFQSIKSRILDLGSKANYVASHFECVTRNLKRERYLFDDFFSRKIQID